MVGLIESSFLPSLPFLLAYARMCILPPPQIPLTSPFTLPPMPLPYVSYETRGSIAASDKKGRSGEEGEGVFKEGEREYKQRR